MRRIFLLLAIMSVLVAFTLPSDFLPKKVTVLNSDEFLSNALISGTVTDMLGRGLGDYQIMYFTTSMMMDSTRSDVSGNWSIPVIGPDTVYVFVVMGDEEVGRFEPEAYIRNIEAGDTLSGLNFSYYLDITEGSTITGFVTLESGEPLDGVVVDAFHVDGEYFTTLTDEFGGYELLVIPGDFEVSAFSEFYTMSPEIISVSVGIEETVEDVNFIASAFDDEGISGQVTLSGGSPVSGMIVVADSESGGLGIATETDEEGYYNFPIFTGVWVVSVEAPAYTSSPINYTVSIEPGTPMPGYDFVLTPSSYDASVSGSVRFDFGEAAGYIDIVVSSASGGFYTTTDEFGDYSFDLPVGEYVLTIDDYTYESTPDEYGLVLTSGDDLTGYDFVLSEYVPEIDALITGTVTLASSGAGIEGILVEAESETMAYSALTDSDGTYEIPVEGTGEFFIYCSTDEHTVSPEYAFEYVLSGDTLTEVDFELTALGLTNAWITGTVVYSDGTTDEGIEVSAYNDFGLGYYGYTDDFGFYLIPVYSGASYDVQCLEPGYVCEPDYYDGVSPAVGDTADGYDFVLSRETPSELAVYATVIDAVGVGIAGVLVEVTNPLGPAIVFSAYTDDSGLAMIYPDFPGSFIGRCPSEETIPSSISFYVDYDLPAYIEFAIDEIIDPDYGLVVLSVDTMEIPFPDLQINWRYSSSSMWDIVTTDGFGSYVFELDSAVSMEFRPEALEGFSITPVMTSVVLSPEHPQDTVKFTIIPESSIEETTKPCMLELAAYPNPFNSSVKIARSSNAPVQIYSLQGKLIETVYGQSWTPKCESGIYVAISGNAKVNLLYIK